MDAGGAAQVASPDQTLSVEESDEFQAWLQGVKYRQAEFLPLRFLADPLPLARVAPSGARGGGGGASQVEEGAAEASLMSADEGDAAAGGSASHLGEAEGGAGGDALTELGEHPAQQLAVLKKRPPSLYEFVSPMGGRGFRFRVRVGDLTGTAGRAEWSEEEAGAAAVAVKAYLFSLNAAAAPDDSILRRQVAEIALQAAADYKRDPLRGERRASLCVCARPAARACTSLLACTPFSFRFN